MTQYRFDDASRRFVDRYNGGLNDHDERPLDDDVIGWNDWGRETWAEIILADQLELCGCQDTDLLKPVFAAYLRGEWGLYEETILQFDAADPLQTLVATICTNIGFVEHGGNIGGSWLRPEGERWLQLLANEETS